MLAYDRLSRVAGRGRLKCASALRWSLPSEMGNALAVEVMQPEGGRHDSAGQFNGSLSARRLIEAWPSKRSP
jgi:hypothetical protein